MQAARSMRPNKLVYKPVSSVGAVDVDLECTRPERPIRVYSYWGSPADNVGEDGDYVLEEITGSLIGPKVDGKWPEDLVKIEGPVVSKFGYFPRWWRHEKPSAASGKGLWWTAWFKMILRFLLTGDARSYGPAQSERLRHSP